MTPTELRDAIQAKARDIAKRSTSPDVDTWAAAIAALAAQIPTLVPPILERRTGQERRITDMAITGPGRRVGQRRGAVRRWSSTPPVMKVTILSTAPNNFEPTDTHQMLVTVETTASYSTDYPGMEGNVLNGRTITYASADTDVATVSATGLVTAVGAGTATLTATCEGVPGRQTDGTLGVTYTVTNPLSAVDHVTLSPTSASVGATGSVVLTATVYDASNNVLSGKTVTWAKAAGTGDVSVTSPGQSTTVTGVAAGTATVTATCETVASAAANLTVTATTYPNEPAGYVTLWTEEFTNPGYGTSGSNHWKTYDRFTEEGTFPTVEGGSNPIQITPTDYIPNPVGDFDISEARVGTDGYVMAMQIPQGWYKPFGSGPPGTWRSSGFSSKPSIYVRMRFKLSTNYAHWNGSKIGYFYAGTKAPVFLSLYPLGAYTTQVAAQSRPARIRMGLQGVIAAPGKGGIWNAEPNLGTSAQWNLSRTSWDIIEIQLVGNSAGQPDGILRMWLNGTQIMEYTDCGWFGGGNSTTTYWSSFKFTPTHDDFNDDSYDFSVYQYFDSFYVSAP